MGHSDDHLYEVSIGTLGLSPATHQLLESVGMLSVGDCLDFLELAGSTSLGVPFGLIDTMYDEVAPRLTEQGYLHGD